MALTVSARKVKSVSFISRIDDAVDMAASNRELYEENPLKHADKLVMKTGKEPTLFILNLDLKAREIEMISNAQLKGVDKNKNAIITMGDWMHTVCRMTLKDIKHPAGTLNPLVEFRKDANGYVKESVMDVLAKYSITQEIFAVYNIMTADDQEVMGNAKN